MAKEGAAARRRRHVGVGDPQGARLVHVRGGVDLPLIVYNKYILDPNSVPHWYNDVLKH
jgi:hypothetical protein